jgi:hypothetical protein
MREKLRANNGCFRCQQFNADHIAANCPRFSSSASSVSSASQPRGRSPSPHPKN